MRPAPTMTAAAPVALLLLLPALAGLAAAEYPTLEYYVTDQVGVLTLQDVYDIEAVCVEVFEAKGAEMAILVVNDTQPDGIDMFTLRTFERNGLGQEGKDDGLLIVLSVSEQAWRIEVGYGLEGVLPDALVGSIADDHLEPFLREGDYYSGLLYTSAFLGREILDHYEEGEPGEEESPYPIPWLPLRWGHLILVVVVLLAVLVLTGGRVWLWVGSRYYGGGGRQWGGGRSGGGGAKGRW